MKHLHKLIESSEDWLIRRILEYAKERGYVKYTSTLEEAWRLSIAGLSGAFLAALKSKRRDLELSPDEDFAEDPVASFGIVEAQRHRERGVSLGMFLGLMKYYRQSYLDLVSQAGFKTEEERRYLRMVERFFDRVEIGFCVEWAGPTGAERLKELQASNRAMTNEKNKYLTLFESLANPVLILDSRNRVDNMNHAAAELARGASTPGAQYYAAPRDAGGTKGRAKRPVAKLLPWLAEEAKAFAAGSASQERFEKSVQIDGESRCFEVKLTRMLDVSDKFAGTVVILNDITERRRAEEILQRAHDELDRRVKERTAELQAEVVHRTQAEEQLRDVNRALLMLSECNEAVVRAAEESELLHRVCQIIVEVGGYRLAWVGFAEQDESKAVRPMAQVGYEEGYLEKAGITWSDTPKGRGPTGTAIRTGRPAIAPDILNDPAFAPWREQAVKRGYASSIALPLSSSGRTFGALSIYAVEPNAFDPERIKLLTELADDLAYGVTALRTRRERQQAEEEKEKMRAQLLQSQKMEAVGTLAGGIAHDFNTLLSVIQLHTDLAAESLKKHESVHQDIHAIQQAAMRAANLTGQLLLFSHKQPMQFAALSANKAVEALVVLLRRLISADIAIETDLAPDLPPIHADKGSIEQVVMNLAINARDAMPQGGRLTLKTEEVHVDEEQCRLMDHARPGRFVRLSVTDNGSGMDPAVAARIFEPFFTTKPAGRGTGLGLSVVYGIVREHGGWINVYSEPGLGSTFKVYLPVSSAGVEAETAEAVPSEGLRGSGERVLLVEDDGALRAAAKTVLERNGYVVCDAAGAEAAEGLFDRDGGDFDLLLTDVILPDRTGLSLADQLLGRRPTLRVLLTSGYMDQKAQWPIIRKSGFSFLQKPYVMAELLRRIRDILETKPS